jgi:DNA-binding SARP family transcriptional activator
VQVSVLGSFGFSAADGSRPLLSGGSQRLLAFLALRSEAVTRGAAAGSLWPEASGDHAASSLRSALTRLGSSTRDAVAVTDIDLRLADDVVVDIRESQDFARRLLEPEAPAAVGELGATSISVLSRDLLPDWYDDWVVPEAEEWRQLRLHALEALSVRLTTAGRFAHAMGAALAAVRVEPLRESATAAVIRVHLAEGNQADARREFRRYRAFLQRELGVEPTTNLFDLVGVARSASGRVAMRGDRPKWAEARVSAPPHRTAPS